MPALSGLADWPTSPPKMIHAVVDGAPDLEPNSIERRGSDIRISGYADYPGYLSNKPNQYDNIYVMPR